MAKLHRTNDDTTSQLVDGPHTRRESALLEEMSAVLELVGGQSNENILVAFAQLAEGTYGYCLDCHRQISSERLEAVTFAVRCAACERTKNAVARTNRADRSPLIRQ